MIAYTKSSLKVAEFYYQPPTSEKGLDIARCFYQASPVEGTRQEVFHTIQIDLTQEPEQLLAAMKKDVRYQIRLAEREGVTTQASSNPSDEWMQQFYAFYDEFAITKQLPPANRNRLNAMREAGMLDLSRSLDVNGNVIVWHCTLKTPTAARIVHSCSLRADAAAKVISAANCLLHFHDMTRFRSENMAIYDFGGWYAGQTDEPKLRINKFKEGFGGKIVQFYNVDRGVTVRGSLAIRAQGLLESWKERN